MKRRSFFAPKPHVVTLTAVSSNAAMDEGKQEVRIILSVGYRFSFFLNIIKVQDCLRYNL